VKSLIYSDSRNASRASSGRYGPGFESGAATNAFREIVQHRVRRVTEQITTVEVRHNFDAARKNVIVQLLHLGVNPFER
jgi:hypothetical protein